jgi:hypothetical protein
MPVAALAEKFGPVGTPGTFGVKLYLMPLVMALD